MRSRACEVVTSDCKCYRWEYNERITNHPNEIRTSQSQTRPGCAMVVFEPKETRELTTIDLMYTLEAHYPTPPASYYYALQEEYKNYLRTLPRNPMAFTSFFYKRVDAFCKAAGKSKKPPHVASRCDKRFLLAIVPVNLADAKTPVTNHIISPLIMGTHLAGFLGLLLHLVSSCTGFIFTVLRCSHVDTLCSLSHRASAAMTEQNPDLVVFEPKNQNPFFSACIQAVEKKCDERGWFKRIIRDLEELIPEELLGEAVINRFWNMALLEENQWKNPHRRGSLQRGVTWIRNAWKDSEKAPGNWIKQFHLKLKQRERNVMHEVIIELFYTCGPKIYESAKSNT